MPLKKNTINTTIFNKSFSKTLNLVVGYTFNKQGIGKDGKLPWHIPEDMEHFKYITTPDNPTNYSIVIMGRKTWDSIPEKFKPLENRYNIILSNDENYKTYQTEKYNSYINSYKTTNTKTGIKFTTWDKLFNDEYMQIENELYQLTLNNPDYIPSIIKKAFNYYIIGGETLYKKAIESNYNLIIHATEIYTQASNSIVCDTFFPKIENKVINTVSPFYKSIKMHNNSTIWYRFITSSRITNSICYKPPPFYTTENDYLNLMNNILETGQFNNDRTGVGTLSIFGSMLKYDLRDTFPISTTKRIFFRAIFEELMLYLSGKTDNSILQDKGIHVWDGNTSREFLDKRGLTNYPTGDMGQTYGFNMRHYGGTYTDCKTEYPPGYGYDQLANVINLIKNDPYSRRIIIDLWDPASIDKAALPSCLCKYQFNVNVEKKELNLAIYLRSSDYFLANNWNTCTGALFVHMLCNLDGIDLVPGELTVFIADAHIYKSHIEQVKQNLERSPYPYPKLIIQGEKKKDILEYKFEDVELIGYKAHPNIKAEMAV
jgi:dihydrofolate reductase / thymidylate synthase